MYGLLVGSAAIFRWSRLATPASSEPEVGGGDADSSTRVVWAVRFDWSDGRHEFIGPKPDAAGADQLQTRTHRQWLRSPVRPALSTVPMSAHDFRLHARHRRDCMAPDCPTAALKARR